MTDDDTLRSLQADLRERLDNWGFSPAARLSLLALSENTTFLAEEGARRMTLRLHRPGYHSAREVRSELAWIAALRQDSVVDTPAPILTAKGDLLATLWHGTETRMAVAFDWVPGREPTPQEDLIDWFTALGATTARLHAHARGWARPAGFIRKRWTVETMLGPRGHWGDWRQALGLDAQGDALLARAVAALETTLARYGTGPDRFGLIHGDLRLANLLVDGDRLRVIDFDDCGFGWFMYDFAAAVSFFEHDSVVPALMEAWTRGYRRLATLPAEDEAILPALVLLRRILLLAWVASHREAPTARAMGEAYTAGALTLAERFLMVR